MPTMLDADDARRLPDLVTNAIAGDVDTLRAARAIVDGALARADGPPAGHQTTIVLEILSPEALPDDADLRGVIREATDGAYSMDVRGWWCVPVDGARLAALTRSQGSDPSLFGIDEHGVPIDEL